MTYPFIQPDVELDERIYEVIHAALRLFAEVVEFGFMGRHTTFVAISGHIGFLKVEEVFGKGH